MNDFLAPIIETNLDLHFGRLASLPVAPDDRAQLVRDAATLLRCIAQGLLWPQKAETADNAVQRHVFAKDKALPPWLVNRCLVMCENDRQRFEPTLRTLLTNNFNRRRFLDYLSNELLYHGWMWSTEDDKRHFPVRCANSLRENGYCLELNTLPFVVKLGDNVVAPPGKMDDAFHWQMRSIGTATLLDLGTKPVFDYTTRLLTAKYKTTFILDVFKDLFTATRQAAGIERYGVLIMGEIPKAFTLAEYQAASKTPAADGNPLTVLRKILTDFDRATRPQFPESRLRLGAEPPQDLTNRVAAMLWLRATLARVKTLQEKKNAPRRGMQVAERTVLLAALDQKSILYFNLSADPADTAINPCHLRTVGDASMELISPRGNRLSEARPGQEVHGYFAVVGVNKKSTYCDFRTTIESVTCPEPSHCLVSMRVPEAFELSRRIHKRLPVQPAMVSLFEMSSPAQDADWSLYGNIEKWPAPFCILPDTAGQCVIKDLSAGGLMLEIHQDAPAFGYFNETNREFPLLVHLHLRHGPDQPPLRLGLRLLARRIRDFPPLRKKYVGFQFEQAGEIRNERFVRFAPVGKDGLFCINDWIFRNGLAR